MRASIYNSMPGEGVEALVAFMKVLPPPKANQVASAAFASIVLVTVSGPGVVPKLCATMRHQSDLQGAMAESRECRVVHVLHCCGRA